MKANELATTLKTKNSLNFYENFYHLNTGELAKALNEILSDSRELEEFKINELYRQNMLDMAQFVYSKYLSERKEVTDSMHKRDRRSLLSSASLSTLYSFGV